MYQRIEPTSNQIRHPASSPKKDGTGKKVEQTGRWDQSVLPSKGVRQGDRHMTNIRLVLTLQSIGWNRKNKLPHTIDIFLLNILSFVQYSSITSVQHRFCK